MPRKRKKRRTPSKTKKPPNRCYSLFHPALLDPNELLVRFLKRVILWLQQNHARVVNLFRKLDTNKDNTISEEEFTIGLQMTNAPTTREEIKRLISIIDTDKNGIIDILEFDKIIRQYHRALLSKKYSELNSDNDDKSVSINFSDSPHRFSVDCCKCLIGRAVMPREMNARFLKLKLTLAPFKDFQQHPAHFSLELTDSTTIHGLCMLIKEHLAGSVLIESIDVFKEPSCSKDDYFQPSHHLYQCGEVGGPRTNPVHSEVFYDYKPLMNNCPLLMDESHLVKIVKRKKSV